MLKTRLVHVYNTLVNGLSFYRGLYKTRRWLNASIDRPEAIETFPDSHPRGFIKKFRKRRISIVESYVKIISFLGSRECSERLAALKLLSEHILHSKTLKMPLNTARVQLALMKEAVKHRDNKRLQMERLRDFSISSFGQPRVIRKYLDELNIIEVPETGQSLKDLNMGWDSHVHDNSSYGRKTPTQLIIDAFIKGISELTIVYNTLSHIEIINEAVEAGRILGITVKLGLEFSVGNGKHKLHYIYLFPYFNNINELVDYLDNRKNDFEFFRKGIEQNQENRIQAIDILIRNFNTTYLPKLNEGYEKGTIYYLEELTLNDVDAVVPLNHATRMHLGEVLFTRFQPVLFNRVLYLKSLKKLSDSQYRNNQIAQWEYLNIQKKYEAARQEYRNLNPERLLPIYFPRSDAFEPKTVFSDLREIFKSSGGDGSAADQYRYNIKIIHPLEHGFARAAKTIIENYEYIGHAEIYNMEDSTHHDPYEVELYARFITFLNTGEADRVTALLEEKHIQYDKEQLRECIRYCSEHPILRSCGSGSTGRTSYIPGMGFILRRHLTKKQEADYLKRHYTLPFFIAQMISESDVSDSSSNDSDSPEEFEIISMGKSKEIPPCEIGDEKQEDPIPLKRAWRYLNPAIKRVFYIFTGFIPAYLTVGPAYALVWFGITAVRNAITDVISGRGYRPREWHFKNIDFENLSHSLFWTGFSVPLLRFVKLQFDQVYPLDPAGFLFEFSKFFYICIVNGLYLYSHNTLRGFDKTTARGNFFRSVLAWPLAAVFAPLGNLLQVPSIVQAKFWSDFVAGLIEGFGKFQKQINLRKRDLESLMPEIRSENAEILNIAILDLLYFFLKDPRTKNSLKYILFNPPTLPRKLLGILRLKKKQVPHDFPDYHRLRQWFSETTHFFQLNDFILGNYREEQVIYLVDLVSETYNDFYRWLLKNDPNE
jgi:hypothetical protein